MSENGKLFLLIKCEKPYVSFCVISERSVILDPLNLVLTKGLKIKFEYPEDDNDSKKQTRAVKKKTYEGIIMNMSSKSKIFTIL